MSQPTYEFFPGAAGAVPQPPEQTPTGYGSTPGPPRPVRPAGASVVSGLLVAEAAILGGPAVTLLVLRDLVGALLSTFSSFSSFASGATAPGGLATAAPDTSSVTGRITMWAALLLVATLGAAVGSTGVLGGRAWGWGLALGVQASGVLWAVLHVGRWTATGTLALTLSLTVAAMLAMPSVRRWCGVAANG